MSKRCFLIAIAAIMVFLGMGVRANAEPFKSPSQCVPGTHVTDNGGKSGIVLNIEQTTMCAVKMDGTGATGHYLFWMLHLAGGSRETNDRLVPGKYECFAGGHYTFMDMYITGPNTYSSAGTTGTFTVYSSRKIVFHGGSLARYYAHLLAGPAIGLNTNGDSFWATTCELKKR
jgi:hypothetical protein